MACRSRGSQHSLGSPNEPTGGDEPATASATRRRGRGRRREWTRSRQSPRSTQRIGPPGGTATCFRGATFADAFAGDDPLFRHVRTRVRSPQTNGVVERFFGTLKYEHLYRAAIGDGNALAVEVNLFRHTYNTLRPHQALDERTPDAACLAVEHCG
jgi:putative transposase